MTVKKRCPARRRRSRWLPVLGVLPSFLWLLPPVRAAALPLTRKVPPPPTAPLPPPPAAVNLEPLRAAERAVAEGLFTVAVTRLRSFLGGTVNLPAPERRAASLLLARALVETGDARGALAGLLPPGEDASPEAAFVRAGVNAALGRWDEALVDYDRAGNAPAVRFGRAECLRALGRKTEADDALATLTGDPVFGVGAVTRRAELSLDANRPDEAEARLRESPPALASPEGRFLLGRAQLDAGRMTEAEETLAALSTGTLVGFSETLLVRTHLALARARAAGGQTAAAIAGLERFGERFPRHSLLGEAFGVLAELRRAATPTVAATVDTMLARWQKDVAEPWRGGFAAVTLAQARRAAGRTEDATLLLGEFPARYPGHPWTARAGVEQAGLLLAAKKPLEARAALAAVRGGPGGDAADLLATREALDARVSLALGDYAAAAARLETMAEAPDLLPARVEGALSAAALARLQARDEEGFQAGRAELERRFPNGSWRRSLPLEEGLLRAAARDRVGAAAVLRAFLATSPVPGPGRAAAARLALAELRYLDGDPDSARAELRFVAAADPPGDTGARAEWLAILAADAPGPGRDENAVVTRARTFLARRPSSPLAAEVRLKLGEIYYRREDYPDAQTELELVPATAAPALYEAARYLAGLAALGAQSPAGADRAVELFEVVAKLNGPLKSAARLRQAETLRDRLEKPADALVLYNAILAATDPAPDVETRCAALTGKAEALLRVRAGDRAGAAEAARLLAEAGSLPEAPLFWRRQALARRGAALERAGDPEGAVVAYADALEVTAPAGVGEDPGSRGDDFTWFYRAGFSAARLLRAAGQWAQAIAVYEKLARLDGPLRAEAEGQAKALRLEHFVWEPAAPE